MLSIIEITQFKHMLFDEKLNPNHQDMISQSTHTKYTRHFLAIPSECVMSAIVRSEDEGKSYKAMAMEIFDKYFKIGSPHEVSVEWETRNKLTKIIESDQWTNNEDDEDPWNL